MSRDSIQPVDRYRTGYLKMRSVLHDRVTGLGALPLLFDRLRTLLDDRAQLGVLHVEVTDLDMVESIYGWQVFDRIIRRVAEVIRAAVGVELPAETELALNGVAGDRFVLVLPDGPDGREVDMAFLAGAARALCLRLEGILDEAAFAGIGPQLGFRAGAALLTDDPFHRFERCIYAAVEEARASPDRRERQRERSWGEELRTIIQGSAIETLYQPVVDLQSGELLGHEALVRGPSQTMYEAPRVMFALSERLGVTCELDRTCIAAAIRDFEQVEPKRKLFVNLVRGSLDEGRLETTLYRVLDETTVARQDVVVELSEGLVTAEDPSLLERMQALKDAGFGLAVDDVGCGRSDLERLLLSRPDYLKVDSSVVRDVDRSQVRREILSTIVGLAARIDAVVIAEGVESAAEVAALVESGVRYGQGFHLGAPAPPRGSARDAEA